jgi:hypothetical protein
MSELAVFFMKQAEAGLHIQFVYDVPAGQVFLLMLPMRPCWAVRRPR